MSLIGNEEMFTKTLASDGISDEKNMKPVVSLLNKTWAQS